MHDRRDHSKITMSRKDSFRIERRVRLLERRRHTSAYRIIHIDMRDFWGLLVSKWRFSS